MKEEKSNYTVSFSGFSAEEGACFRPEYLNEPYWRSFKGRELKKNRFELWSIKILLGIINEILGHLEIDMKFNPNLNKIHIFKKRDFKLNVVNKEFEATFEYGHIYLYRSSSWKFISNLSHELGHLLSYYELNVKKGARGHQITTAQTGLNVKPYFYGFNEAITEIFSIVLIEIYTSRKSPLNKRQQEMLISRRAYYPHIEIVNKILATDNICERWEKIKPFFRSYIFGDDNFISKIPFSAEQIERLKKLEPSDKEAIDFLKSLELEGTV